MWQVLKKTQEYGYDSKKKKEYEISFHWFLCE